MSFVIQINYAWKPIIVDVLNFNFEKIGTKKIWLRSYYTESGENLVNEGRPYTLEWMLKKKHRFY
jgi:hypothetical protein